MKRLLASILFILSTTSAMAEEPRPTQISSIEYDRQYQVPQPAAPAITLNRKPEMVITPAEPEKTTEFFSQQNLMQVSFGM